MFHYSRFYVYILCYADIFICCIFICSIIVYSVVQQMFNHLEQYKKPSKQVKEQVKEPVTFSFFENTKAEGCSCNLCVNRAKKPGVINKQEINADLLCDCQLPSMIPRSEPYFVDRAVFDWIDKHSQKSLLELFPRFCPSEFEKVGRISKEKNKEINEWAKITSFDSNTNKDNFIKMVEYECQGWCIVIQQFENYLAVGNSGCHPFVQTKGFTFVNSDGSTNDDCPKAQSPSEAIKVGLQIARKFVLEQAH